MLPKMLCKTGANTMGHAQARQLKQSAVIMAKPWSYF
jgi:hypothetical protein